jgi:hypothetical protein
MKRTFIFWMMLVFVTPLVAQTPPIELAIKTTICDIKAYPENFEHKLVEFRATASHGFEDSMVTSSECPWTTGFPDFWIEFGGKHSTDTMYCCGFSPSTNRPETFTLEGMEVRLTDNNLFRKFDMLLHPLHPPKGRSATVDATLQGRIFIRHDGIGYGHMGCCTLFVVTKVVSIGKHGTRPD